MHLIEKISMKHLFISCLIFCAAALSSRATVQPNGIFADHMVLQRQMPIAVWGTAKDGESISVELKGANVAKTVSTVATNGKWEVKLPPFQAGGPYTMTITGENMVTINDVLIGEVWLCSGQSNMEEQISSGNPPITDADKEIAAANYPQIRQYFLEERRGKPDVPNDSVPGSWSICSPATVPHYTAVGYFFARDLYEKMHVPVGIILAAVGGTPVMSWTSHEAMMSNPVLKEVVQKNDMNKKLAQYKIDLADYKTKESALLDQYNKDLATATAAGKPAPPKPQPPRDPEWDWDTSIFYNGMIKPIEPYTIRGVLWYQGESDNGAAATIYKTNFSTMIADWRKAWGEGNFPFLFVQIANAYAWDPATREAQLLTWQTVPNTGMIVTTDIGSWDAHPPHKQLVGGRLALAARNLVYGEKNVEFSGPIYKSVDFDGNKATVHFTHVGSGLEPHGGDLQEFEVSGDGKTWSPATATIQDDTVVVSSPQVQNPQAVRMGWDGLCRANLFSKDGLPASPFVSNMQ
jgi:sialate O-acetylesterase